MDLTIKIKLEDCSPKVQKRLKKQIEQSQTIRKFIREGKDLTKLKEHGINLEMPI